MPGPAQPSTWTLPWRGSGDPWIAVAAAGGIAGTFVALGLGRLGAASLCAGPFLAALAVLFAASLARLVQRSEVRLDAVELRIEHAPLPWAGAVHPLATLAAPSVRFAPVRRMPGPQWELVARVGGRPTVLLRHPHRPPLDALAAALASRLPAGPPAQ